MVSHPKSRTLLATSSMVLLVLITSACSTGSSPSASGGSADLTQLTLALPTGSPLANVSFIPVGVENGYFAKQGIDLKVNYLQGGTAVASAVQAGQADLALTSPEPLVLAAQQGGDLQSVYQVTNQLIYNVGFLPGSRVQAWADLPTAKIGVVSPGNIPTYRAYLNHELASRGLPPVEQANLIAVGEGSSATAAVQSKQVDALFLTDTGLVTTQAGVPDMKIETLPSFKQGFPGLVLMARKTVISEKAAALKKALTAFAEATKSCNDSPNECISTFAHVAPNAVPDRKSADQQWAARSKLYQDTVDGRYGMNSQQAWQLVEDIQKDAGLVKNPPPAAQLFTNDLIPTKS